MPESVKVVVTVIYSGRKVLLAYSPKWQTFTLPMTKLRRWPYGADSSFGREEDLTDAAMRNVGEALGRTSTGVLIHLLETYKLAQSDRDAKNKGYSFEIFGLPLSEMNSNEGQKVEWLTADEVLDKDRRPISPTARHLIQHLQAEAVKKGTQFPPP